MDGIDDDDGCPDTDAVIKSIVKDNAYDVDVSVNTPKQISVTYANVGNIMADLEGTLLLRSTKGVCEAHWVPQPGDQIIEDVVGTTIFSEIDPLLQDMLPGEERTFTRTYKVHCFAKSFHDNAVRFDAGVVPVYPVAEENPEETTCPPPVGSGPGLPCQVHKQYIDITAWKKTDVRKVGMVVLPDPDMQVGVPTQVTVRSVMHNDGPFGPVQVNDEFTGSAPADCTMNSESGNDIPLATRLVNLPVSVTVIEDVAVWLECASPSFHVFGFVNEIVGVPGVHVRDTNPNNNSATLSRTVPVKEDADVKVTTVSIPDPGGLKVNTNVNLTVAANLHNNGPYGPVSGTATINLALPSDCTKVPAAAQSKAVSLASSVATPVSATWLVKCSSHSTHVLTGSVSLNVGLPLHVTDPNPGNNSSSAQVAYPVYDDMDKAVTAVTIEQEPPFVDLDGVALVEDRRATDPGDPNDDKADVTRTMAKPSVGYELFASVTTKANTNTTAYDLAVDISSGSCTVSGDTTIAEPPEAAGAINTQQVGGLTVSIAGSGACTVDVTATLSQNVLHISDTNSQNDSLADSVLVCSDRDEDGVADPEAVVTSPLCAPADNCPDVANPGQADSDGDAIGDACDPTPTHDVFVDFCVAFGPLPVNLSDTLGSHMWTQCSIGNASAHTERVHIGNIDGLQDISGLPIGCAATQMLITPSQPDFILLEGEQKFVQYRTKFECHDAVPGSYPVTVSFRITHIDNPEGAETSLANNQVSVEKNVVVSSVQP